MSDLVVNVNRDNRYREWFLTINENAQCYNDFVSIMDSESEKIEFYAFILHNKDNEEQPHFHAYVKFKNARYFGGVQKLFFGAHIEVVKNTKLSIQYLVHKNDLDKHKYDIDLIQTNIQNITDIINYQVKAFDTFDYDLLDTYLSEFYSADSRLHSYQEFLCYCYDKFGGSCAKILNYGLCEIIKCKVSIYNDFIRLKETTNIDF